MKNVCITKKQAAGSFQNKLWPYRKWVFPVFFAVILLLAFVLGYIKISKRTTIMAGICVNVTLSEAGKTYLTNDYKSFLRVDSPRKMVYLGQTAFDALASAEDCQESYYAIASLTSLCDNKEVDYMILDQEGFEIMLLQKVYLDLQLAFTQEALEALDPMVVNAQNQGDTAPKPIALKITDCPFIRENAGEKGEVYFAFAAGSPRTDTCKDLFTYLLAWGAEEQKRS